jgi:lipoprotein-anchoring transpeptidase ErfK/SrfK
MLRRSLALLLSGLIAATQLHAQPAVPLDPYDTPAQEADEPEATAPVAEPQPIAPNDWLSLQVELFRLGFSCGSIDGIRGSQTITALKAWQKNEGLKETGDLDPVTRAALLLRAPALTEYTFTADDLAAIAPVPPTWLEKSQVDALRYNTALELVAERARANPKLIVKLNPQVNWDTIQPGTVLKVPSADPVIPKLRVSRIHVYLAERVLQVVDENGRVLFHSPVSIAKNVEKRPVGELHVIVVAPNPNYTFDPAVFPEVPEAAELGRRLIIPPGPNNPVGAAWIGLDRPGYGIHGTPDPEKVGRTESHGCFRLANWDARVVLSFVWTGMPVMVEE